MNSRIAGVDHESAVGVVEPNLSVHSSSTSCAARLHLRRSLRAAALNLRYCFDSLRKSVNSSDELNRQPDFLAAAVSSAVSRLGLAEAGGDASARRDLQCHVRRFSARLRGIVGLVACWRPGRAPEKVIAATVGSTRSRRKIPTHCIERELERAHATWRDATCAISSCCRRGLSSCQRAARSTQLQTSRRPPPQLRKCQRSPSMASPNPRRSSARPPREPSAQRKKLRLAERGRRQHRRDRSRRGGAARRCRRLCHRRAAPSPPPKPAGRPWTVTLALPGSTPTTRSRTSSGATSSAR